MGLIRVQRDIDDIDSDYSDDGDIVIRRPRQQKISSLKDRVEASGSEDYDSDVPPISQEAFDRARRRNAGPIGQRRREERRRMGRRPLARDESLSPEPYQRLGPEECRRREQGYGPSRGARSEPRRGGFEMRPGDWTCPDCGAHNFARRDQCFKCNADRSGRSSRRAPVSRDDGLSMSLDDIISQETGRRPRPYRGGDRGDRGAGSSFQMRPGDWNCPKCGTHNFARRSECFKCGAPGGSGDGGGRSRESRSERSSGRRGGSFKDDTKSMVDLDAELEKYKSQ